MIAAIAPRQVSDNASENPPCGLPLQGLFRSAQHKKQAEFLGRSFDSDKDRAAAAKNAFVLLAQHRPQLAAAFFILGIPSPDPHTAQTGCPTHQVVAPNCTAVTPHCHAGAAQGSTVSKSC